MRSLIFFILFCIPVLSQAQSIGIAPNSMDLWGTTPSTSVASIEYKWVGVHYFWYRGDRVDIHEAPLRSAIGFSVKPIQWKGFKAGLVSFHRPFPTANATRINVWFEWGFDIGLFNISYNHVSNAWTGRLNPGIDFIKLSYQL